MRGQGHVTHFYILGPKLYLFGADEARHFKFGLQTEREVYSVYCHYTC